ncbi:MAG: glycosyltransferase family 1 protein [Hyphomonas sp.]|nr:glycosyltransferase family 1 protein [Hyphomonas sp.]MCB9972310.1 glycosyltransferase family 1 protein [Hyphomonas sp.]
MRIMLVTDAWDPQVNGVVRTMKRVVAETEAMGHVWEIVHPGQGFLTMPLPTYPEIKLALFARSEIEERFREFEPDAVHIATEGTLGMTGRAMCLTIKHPFSTAYHTRFPEYVAARLPVPVAWGYSFVRWFHKYSGKVMVPTPSMVEELKGERFINLISWSRGVDTELFHPSKRIEDGQPGDPFEGMQRPIFINVGRVAVEKNIETFAEMDLPGTKVIIGDGPQREELQRKYPDVKFLGARFGEDLATCYASADVFVFPSLTDTFGLVVLESMASGTPVAAFEATGPRDVIPGSNAGMVAPIGGDLTAAAKACLDLSRATCRKYAEGYSWRVCAEEFIENLQPLPAPARKRFWQKIRLRRRKKPLELVIPPKLNTSATRDDADEKP